ncbi:MAG: energy transducer TonB [Bacteroidetes bacterium]|nr:energy transducer TonB [Bacteroidota bacterium]
MLTDSSLQENAFYNEGTILLNDKKYNEAIPFLEKAIQINIKNVQSLYNLGICKLKLGDSVAACNLWWEIKAMNSKIANSVLVKYCLNRWEGTSEIANIESEHATDLDHTFTIVEQMPEFPGGEEFLISYIQCNFRYPKLMRERKVMGTVYLTFVVQYDGKIADIRILKGSQWKRIR